MPTSSLDAEVLRRRAAALRRLSTSISSSEAVDLRRRAGSDAWVGPTAARCADELTLLGRKLIRAGDDLLVRARAMEQRALQLEIVASGAGAR